MIGLPANYVAPSYFLQKNAILVLIYIISCGILGKSESNLDFYKLLTEKSARMHFRYCVSDTTIWQQCFAHLGHYVGTVAPGFFLILHLPNAVLRKCDVWRTLSEGGFLLSTSG